MDDVILQVTSRPARIVTLIRDRRGFQWAIRTLTHIWGGAASVLLPYPTSDEDYRPFLEALGTTNPDLILVQTTDDNGDRVDAPTAAKEFPCPVQALTASLAASIPAGDDQISIAGSDVPHLASVLHESEPAGLELEIYVTSNSQHSLPETFVFGAPSNLYVEFLADRYHVKRLHPKNDTQSLTANLLAPQIGTPISLTLRHLRRTQSLNIFESVSEIPLKTKRVAHQGSLFLFIDEDDSLQVPAAFWNARRVATLQNKFLIPRSQLFEALGILLHDLFNPAHLRELVIFTEMSRSAAAGLLGRITQYLSGNGVQLATAVYPSGYEYCCPPVKLLSGSPQAMTKPALADGSVRFRPPIPPGHSYKRSLFGIDVDVDLGKGRELSLPVSRVSSALLRNPEWRLERARDKPELATLYLNEQSSLRPQKGGVTGTTNPESECRFHLHTPERIVREYLITRGVKLTPSASTRFVSGIVRRLGGIDKTRKLLSEGMAYVLKTLAQHRESAGGMELPQIWMLMSNEFDLDEAEAERMVMNQIDSLTASGLVRRGVSQICEHCNFKDWYSLEKLDEFVECNACAQDFQPGGKFARYTYRLNELAFRFLEVGGAAVLEAADVLNQIDRSAVIHYGGNLIREGEKQRFGEIDVVAVLRYGICLVEAKDYYTLQPTADGTDRKEQIVDAARELLKLARELDSPDILLVLVTEASESAIRELLARMTTIEVRP